MSTILLATDGSPSAAQATAIAIELATVSGRPLRVVSVWHPPVTAAIGFGTVGMPTEIIEAERLYASDVAERAVELARRAGASATCQVREGDSAGEICAAAAECAAGMVVIGAHGWGPVRRMLFGSVSTRVLHEAPCAVLVVRGERAHDEAAAAA